MQLPQLLIDCLEQLRMFASKNFPEEVAQELSITSRTQGTAKVVEGIDYYLWYLPQDSEEFEFANELNNVVHKYVKPLEAKVAPPPPPEPKRHFGFRVD